MDYSFWYFKQNAAEKLPSFIPNWTVMYVVNALVVVWVLVVGFGFGGWASMTNFIKQVDTFGLFAKCYQCPPKLTNHTLHHWEKTMFLYFYVGWHLHHPFWCCWIIPILSSLISYDPYVESHIALADMILYNNFLEYFLQHYYFAFYDHDTYFLNHLVSSWTWT